jgi:hypothetical protein
MAASMRILISWVAGTISTSKRYSVAYFFSPVWSLPCSVDSVTASEDAYPIHSTFYTILPPVSPHPYLFSFFFITNLIDHILCGTQRMFSVTFHSCILSCSSNKQLVARNCQK